MGIYRRILAFYYGRQSVDRFDFAAVVNGHYELTFGTIPTIYARATNAFGNNARISVKTDGDANMDLNSFVCSRIALTSPAHALSGIPTRIFTLTYTYIVDNLY